MNAKIVLHYAKDDPKCSGDYNDVELFIDGNLVEAFGDHYHDKGSIKAEAFLEGAEWAIGKEFTVVREKVADRDQ